MPGRKKLLVDTTIYETSIEQIKVGKEKGCGGSAIVYEGQKISNGKSEFCLIKEIYPIGNDVFRNENGTIRTNDEKSENLYQRVLSACKSEVCNQAKLVGSDAPRNDTMLRASEYISPEMSVNGNAYLILDTVECKTLADIKSFSVYDACKYIEKLLAAVSYIHQKGALHLDIAPDNVIVAETTDAVRLIDFNSSCFKDEETNLYHSASFKKGYSASEVRDGFLRNICAASDLFSVTAVMHTMIFNELYEDKEEYKDPRRQTSVIGRKVAEKLDNIISKPAERLLVEIFCKGLAHYASKRYQTAKEMLAEIKKLAELVVPTAVYPLDLSTHTRSLLPNFCQERDSMLEAVHQKLEKHNHVFVGGIGGSGKSALSAMYINKFSAEYDAVQTFTYTSCKDIIKAVGFAGLNDNDSYYKEHPDDLYAVKLHALQEKTDARTLLIIENYIKCKDDCFDELLKCHCRIIFNTRNNLESADFLPLKDISEDEALEYFLHVSEREKEVETIREIIPYTGRNFLLMKLLALKLRSYPNITAESILNKLRSNECFDKGRFSFDKFSEETQDEILREVFDISDLSKEQLEVLSAMTLVPYCGIKEVDFVSAISLNNEENPIDVLVRLGWITRTGKDTNKKILLHQTISDFLARTDETKPDFDKFAPLLEKIGDIFGIDNAKTLAEREEVLSATDFFARRITGENLVCAEIYTLIGINYFEEYKFHKALNYHSKVLKIRLSILGENNRVTARSYNYIGSVYDDLGDYDKALEYHNTALKIQQSVLGENNPDTAGSYGNIGCVYHSMEDYDKALKYYNMALKIQQSVLGENNRDTAKSYNNIGLVYANLGDYDKALRYYSMALKIQQSVLGENHPDTALSYSNISLVYSGLGDYNKALEYCNTTLKTRLSVLGENHPATASSYSNIGAVYYDLGDYDKALEYYNQVLKIRKLVLDENHPDIAVSYNNIGVVYYGLGEYDKALEYYKTYLKILLSVFCENNQDTARSYHNIGLVYGSLGDYDKALEYHNTALKIRLSVLGENHPDTMRCRNNIEMIKSKLKQ